MQRLNKDMLQGFEILKTESAFLYFAPIAKAILMGPKMEVLQ